MKSFSVSWVDLAVLIVLIVGVWRGRKRGMSEELLDIIKWIVIVVAAAFVYEPAGRWLAGFNVFSLLSCYLLVYLLVALVIFLTVALIRQRIGAKLVGSDVFGRGEYYLGMAAGCARYGCILLVAMAFLNARYYSPADRQSSAKYQEDNFGSRMFFTLPELQAAVFDDSFSGRLTHQYLRVVLIKPTAPSDEVLGGSGGSIKHRREGTIDQILEKK